MSTSLGLRSIKDIVSELQEKGEMLFIPSYQRGYRWTEREVTDLLDDLWDFAQVKRTGEIYCLQPVVVTRRSASSWEVIDGQQRLTTIRILLSYFSNEVSETYGNVFAIDYETRPGSHDFLDRIDDSRKEENIDYFYMVIAYQTISRWCQLKARSQLETIFYPTLLENTHIIWYEVDSARNAIDIFTRINIGKIPLTNAELIKALFLSSDNFKADKEHVRVRQLEIAGEWDRMETSLCNPKMWYFLSDPKNIYTNRIEFLFDFISLKPAGSDTFFTFRYFADLFNEQSDVTEQWTIVKTTYLRFEEWFQDPAYYHLVGYLITSGTSLRKLWEESRNLCKSEFLKYLQHEIRAQFDKPVADFRYKDARTRMVLLLFNIQTLLKNDLSNMRFPFDEYKCGKWDIEHIHAVQSQMPEKEKHQLQWLREVVDFLRGRNDQLTERVELAIAKMEASRPIEFVSLYREVLKAYTDENDDDDVNDISNLTLLDAATNRGYKNSIFPVKRQKIISKDLKGTFIPPCTKNVFFKYYTIDPSQMVIYSRNDRDCYLNAMEETLAAYFPATAPAPGPQSLIPEE